MTKSQKKILSFIIKLSVVTLAGVFIFIKLSDNQNIKNFNEIIHHLEKWKVWVVMLAIFLLMFLNWFLESLKWRFLISKVEKISSYKAVESVFCGLTWAIFTPNRIGEYGGRIFFLSPRKRIQGVVAMLVGNVSQMLVTNVFGSLALLWFIFYFLKVNNILFVGISFLTVVFCFFFILFYFNIKWLDRLLSGIRFLNRFKKFFEVFNRYNKSELSKILIFSISRYLVFTTQYLFIIHLLVPEIPFYDSALMVFTLFFIQSAIPSLDIFDVGVRSITATYLFSFITHQEIAIITSAALIWLVNLIIPAILGSFFVFKLNFFDSRR